MRQHEEYRAEQDRLGVLEAEAEAAADSVSSYSTDASRLLDPMEEGSEGSADPTGAFPCKLMFADAD